MFHLLNMIASGWTSICYSGWFFTANRLKGESNHMLKCTNLMSSARVIMHGRPIQSLVFRFHTRHCPVSLSEAHTEIHTVTCTHKGTHRHTRTHKHSPLTALNSCYRSHALKTAPCSKDVKNGKSVARYPGRIWQKSKKIAPFPPQVRPGGVLRFALESLPVFGERPAT